MKGWAWQKRKGFRRKTSSLHNWGLWVNFKLPHNGVKLKSLAFTTKNLWHKKTVVAQMRPWPSQLSMQRTLQICGLLSNPLTTAGNCKVLPSQPKIFGTKKLHLRAWNAELDQKGKTLEGKQPAAVGLKRPSNDGQTGRGRMMVSKAKDGNIRSQLNSTNWWQNLVSGNFSTLKKKKNQNQNQGAIGSYLWGEKVTRKKQALCLLFTSKWLKLRG